MRQLAYDRDHQDDTGIWVYQWFLPHTRVLVFWSSREQPPARYIISSQGWQREHPGQSATALWLDPTRDQALWRLGP